MVKRLRYQNHKIEIMGRWQLAKHNEKNNELLLSIIVPIYNGEKYISTLLDSIINNNGQDFSYEIILINDGSTDQSEMICHHYGQKFSNIRYYSKDNGGIASARNEGVSKAKGKYITFADQDDIVIGSYKKHLEKCKNEQLEMLITSYCACQNERIYDVYKVNDEIIDNRIIIKGIVAGLIDNKYFKTEGYQSGPNSVWNVFFNRNLIVENGIYFKSFVDYEDDWIFNIEAMLHANKIAMSCEKYYCWNIHDASESHRGKYIDDLISKRKNWMNWLFGVLELLNLDEETVNAFIKNVLVPRNIMISFKNTCWKPDTTINDKIEEIIIATSGEGWNINSVDVAQIDEMNHMEKILFILLRLKCFRTAYFLNRYVFKRRFH